MARRAREHGWLRVADSVAQQRRRTLVLVIGSQATLAALFGVGAIAGLPGRAGWQDLIVMMAFAWSAWAARCAAPGPAPSRWDADAYAVALLGSVVALAVGGLVGPAGGSVATGLPFLVLLVTAAPWLRPLAVAALGSAGAAAHLGLLVVAGRPEGTESWFTLLIVLGLVVAVSRTGAADRHLLGELLELEASDPVSGLPNARYLAQAVEHAFAAASDAAPLAVLAMRVDRQPGVRFDEVIPELARTLRGELRDGDVLAAAGDEVLVAVLPGLDEELAWDVARTLRNRAARPARGRPAVALRVGLAVHPAGDPVAPPTPSASRLVGLARHALAGAESAVGDRVMIADVARTAAR